jgi:hypothetical protein
MRIIGRSHESKHFTLMTPLLTHLVPYGLKPEAHGAWFIETSASINCPASPGEGYEEGADSCESAPLRWS